MYLTHIATLTFIDKSDILLVCRSESLCWALGLLRGSTVVAFPVETIEHNLWRWSAAEKTRADIRRAVFFFFFWMRIITSYKV